MTNEKANNQPQISEAEQLAENVMKAAGSSLRHYMPHSRAEIIRACQAGIAAARAEHVEALDCFVKWTERHGLNKAELTDGRLMEVPVVITARRLIAGERGRA